MTRLLLFNKDESGVYADSHAKTLDALWAEAESLGKVGVECKTFDSGYRSTIQFKTKSGSMVFSHGEGDTPYDALLAGIKEAVSLGAGDPQ